MTRNSCLVIAGFILCMAGLFLWTLNNEVAWPILGFAALAVCYAVSERKGSDNG
jgi:hypothetical protein